MKKHEIISEIMHELDESINKMEEKFSEEIMRESLLTSLSDILFFLEDRKNSRINFELQGYRMFNYVELKEQIKKYIYFILIKEGYRTNGFEKKELNDIRKNISIFLQNCLIDNPNVNIKIYKKEIKRRENKAFVSENTIVISKVGTGKTLFTKELILKEHGNNKKVMVLSIKEEKLFSNEKFISLEEINGLNHIKELIELHSPAVIYIDEINLFMEKNNISFEEITEWLFTNLNIPVFINAQADSHIDVINGNINLLNLYICYIGRLNRKQREYILNTVDISKRNYLLSKDFALKSYIFHKI